MGEYTIFIINMSGSTIPVKVSAYMTVKQLKEKILEVGQFDMCLLKCETNILTDDSKTLEHYKISPNHSIYMLARLRGGLLF